MRYLAHRRSPSESSYRAGFFQHCSLCLIRHRTCGAAGTDRSYWARLDFYSFRCTVSCNNSNDSCRDPVGASMAPETKCDPRGSTKWAAASPNSPGSCGFPWSTGRPEVKANRSLVRLLVGVQPTQDAAEKITCKRMIFAAILSIISRPI